MQTTLAASTLTLNLSQILSLEDDPELLTYYCPGTNIPVWALIRVAFIRTIMSELLFKTAPLMASYQQRPNKQVVQYVMRSVAHNVSHHNNYASEICLFSSGLGNYSRNSQTFDRLAGYFANVYPENSFIYQGHGGWRWHSNFQFPRVLYAAPFNLCAQVVSRIRLKSQHVRLAAKVVDRATSNAQKRFGHIFMPRDLAVLKSSLAQQLAAMPFVTDYYAGWFFRHKIKLLLKEDASYGAHSIPVLTGARLAGVTTAEYQHGAISAGHDGYNVGSAVAQSSEFQQTLPEYLLTYGEWWGEQINMPLRRIVIGNPHFTESTNHILVSKEARDRILILGDGVETELYLDLANNVAKIAGGRGMRVFIRPHPLERYRMERAVIPSGVEIDKNSDIYQSFADTSIVISELSTGLFEAVNLVDRVVMWDTEKARFAFPKLPFQSFSSFSELEDALFGQPNGQTETESCYSCDRSRIWANNWQLNYKNFIESILSK